MNHQPERRARGDAHARIDTHEEVCALRYEQIAKDTSEMRAMLKEALASSTIVSGVERRLKIMERTMYGAAGAILLIVARVLLERLLHLQ